MDWTNSALAARSKGLNNVRVSYEPTGYGWAFAEFVVGAKSARLSLSLSSKDPLAVLLIATYEAVSRRGRRGHAAVGRFDHGAGGWVLDLWAQYDDLRLMIHWNEDGHDIQVKTVLEAKCSLREFAWAVWAEASRLLRELDSNGYSARSAGFAFPAEPVAALHRALIINDACPLAKTAERLTKQRMASGK